MSSLIEDLRSQIANGSVLVVVGAGVSMAATQCNALASWRGLLKHGVSRCMEVDLSLAQDWANRMTTQIESNDVLEMVSAAQNISQRLGYPNGGIYRKWLRDSVGGLRAIEPSLIKAIANLNVPIATTNYDGLLTEVTGRRPVMWTDRALTQRWFRNDEGGVLHLHGHWETPESVILGISSYEDILRDEHTQTLMKSCLMARTMLFVGFGGGLSDPNFGALLDWDRRILIQSEYFHYRLALNSDVAALREQGQGEQRVFVLGYGEDHDALIPFLQQLGAAPKTCAVVPSDLQLLTDGRADIDRRRSILETRKETFTEADYLRELSRIAFDLAQIGGIRSAWMMLNAPFLKNSLYLNNADRIDIGIKLAGLMLDDDSAESARRVLEDIQPQIDATDSFEDVVFSFWLLRSRCFVQLCAHDEAIKSLETTRSFARDDQARELVAAEVAELYFMQGDIEKAIIASQVAGQER